MQNLDISKLKIAKPCGVGWESMTGDEKMRVCDSCELNVYNIEKMTEREITRLFLEPGGRVCGRIRKRADGTVITRECPKGLRDYGKRVARITTAAMTAVFAAFSFSYGQSTPNNSKQDSGETNASKRIELTGIEGFVGDQTGAAIPGSVITVLKEVGVAFRRTVTANKDGIFRMENIPAGEYQITISSAGFKSLRYNRVSVEEKKMRSIEAKLGPAGELVIVGIFDSSEPYIDFGKTDISTVIRPPWDEE